MGKTVEQLLEEISSAELAEWIAFSRLEPFGPEWDQWRSANLAAVVANYTSLNVPRRDFTAADFMPRIRRQQTIEEMIAAFKALG